MHVGSLHVGTSMLTSHRPDQTLHDSLRSVWQHTMPASDDEQNWS
jgi:hypothetical protein